MECPNNNCNNEITRFVYRNSVEQPYTTTCEDCCFKLIVSSVDLQNVYTWGYITPEDFKNIRKKIKNKKEILEEN